MWLCTDNHEIINSNNAEVIFIDYGLGSRYAINVYMASGKCFILEDDYDDEDLANAALETMKDNINAGESFRREV